MTLCRYVALRGTCKMLKYSEIQRKRQSDIATGQKLLLSVHIFYIGPKLSKIIPKKYIVDSNDCIK